MHEYVSPYTKDLVHNFFNLSKDEIQTRLDSLMQRRVISLEQHREIQLILARHNWLLRMNRTEDPNIFILEYGTTGLTA